MRRVVVFNETGEERKVERRCRKCEAAHVWTNGWSHAIAGIVSPTGIEHTGVTTGTTACGVDATGDGWWWPE